MTTHHYKQMACIGCAGLDLPGLDKIGASSFHNGRQCPISIHTSAVLNGAPGVALAFEDNASEILHSGHSIEVRFAPGDTLERGGVRYMLRQLHFHTPSETFIDGEAFPMETHLVYQALPANAPEGALPEESAPLLVAAVFVKAGKANPALAELLANAPADGESPRDFVGFDPEPLVPASFDHFSFEGSLTTPPFTEGVQWIVLKTPVEASAEQIAAVEAILGNNARSIQPLNGRTIAKHEA